MASFHCSVKSGKSGSGGAHADYIERDGKYKSKSKDDLEHVERGNMPEFAAENPSEFWKAADQYERANGAAYREYEIALPRELTKEQRLELVREFVAQEIGDKHAYTFAIHNPIAAIDGGEQPHAHIMFSERTNDGINRPAEQYFKRWNAKNPERGGCQKSNTAKTPTERKADLVALRERFAELQNKHLAKAGHQVRVTHLSLKDQGIDRLAEPHFGPKLAKELAAAVKIDREAVPRTPTPIVLSPKISAERHGISPMPEPVPQPKQPEKERVKPKLEASDLQIYLAIQSKITAQYRDGLDRAKEAAERLDTSTRTVNEWDRQAKNAHWDMAQMPKRPMFSGRAQWDAQRAELEKQYQKAAEARKEAQIELKTLQAAKDAMPALASRETIRNVYIERMRLHPELLQQYERGRVEHQREQEQQKAISQVKQRPQEQGYER
jgi:hypothetical protein